MHPYFLKRASHLRSNHLCNFLFGKLFVHFKKLFLCKSNY
ncbi:hypothetical protein HMPREF9445_03024 [Bacteroides clarus YIT 12056]|uniref:Uncharacterized protein n=1 Tax=Bacteroides clarus YIT 12056 TaxID=762984 RepID=A0ABN0CK31_9BACE|nr:hypothetical protein HMPREF9445_03024 [Bacteroides clarus YIT 12056]